MIYYNSSHKFDTKVVTSLIDDGRLVGVRSKRVRLLRSKRVRYHKIMAASTNAVMKNLATRGMDGCVCYGMQLSPEEKGVLIGNDAQG